MVCIERRGKKSGKIVNHVLGEDFGPYSKYLSSGVRVVKNVEFVKPDSRKLYKIKEEKQVGQKLIKAVCMERYT